VTWKIDGLDEGEFLTLWQLRYLRADGTPWPGIHLARLMTAITILRGAHPERLVPYHP
jgi:hypothetical protein